MDKYIEKYNKFVLKSILKIVLVILLIAAVIAAVFVGFAVDFASCFGKPSCSGPGAPGANFVVFPLAVLAIAGFIYSRVRQKKQAALRQEVPQQASQSAGEPPQSAAGQPARAVRSLLEQDGPLPLAAIQQKTGLTEEVVLAALKSMLEEGSVSQHITPDAPVVFDLKK